MIRETDTHYFFWSGDSTFSNWAYTPFVWNTRNLENSEVGMMLQKAYLFDYSMVKKIINTQNPSEVKKLGRQVKNFDKNIWEKKCVDLVVEVLLAKFSQVEECKKELLSTGNKIIVESSPYDKIWGIGLATNDDRVLDEKNWNGQNLLGKALMITREKIKENPEKIWKGLNLS